MYYIAVCDDNREFLTEMKEAIERNAEYEQEMEIDLFSDGRELLKTKKLYHLVILDMQMDGLGGYETAQQIRMGNSSTVIAFCSGIVPPKPEHFHVQPYRYLIKTMESMELSAEISELLVEMKRRKEECYVEVAYDGKACRVNVRDILYIERMNRSSRMIVDPSREPEVWEPYINGAGARWITKRQNGTLEIYSNEPLSEWYIQLADRNFEYAHNSYIVNLLQIRSVFDKELILMDMEQLSITRKYKHTFDEHFSHYYAKKYRRDVK